MANIRATHRSGAVGVTINNALIGSNTIGESLNLEMNSYSHKRIANGGFWDAQITLAGNLSSLLPSIESLIGLDVETVSEAGAVAWNGFVNQVTLESGLGSFSIGPLMNVRNNLSVVFQTTRYNTIPPIGGQRRRLSPLADAASQERYGILGHELSGGTGDTTGAQNLQETHLEEFKQPRVNQSLTVGGVGSSSISVSLQCIGYVQLLDKFIYEANVAGDTVPATKILDILEAEPNELFSSLYEPVANTLSIPNYEEGATAWSVIKSIVALGDTSFNRYIFGIGPNRNGLYNQVESDYKYDLQVNGDVHDKAGNIIKSWDITPGVWMSASSIITGENLSGDIGTHVSDVFIESVTYTAPDSAGIEGGNVDRSVQQLAQRGVGGSF